jgi:hypothetical protein
MFVGDCAESLENYLTASLGVAGVPGRRMMAMAVFSSTWKQAV